MLKTISFLSISIHHVFASYWIYLHSKSKSNRLIPTQQQITLEISQVLMNKIRIIYENSMIGIMMGLSFFHLIPISNNQIISFLQLQKSSNLNSRVFPYGTLTAVLAFVFVLANSNYFYHSNSTKNRLKIGNFRNRFQFEHQILSNKKLKIHRRLAIQSLGTQMMISMPSILLTSCLASDNKTEIWFWCLTIVLFEKHRICQKFSRSYYAAGLQKEKVLKLILVHLSFSLIFMAFGCFLVDFYPIMNGVMNGISCGVILYDIMIEKLANNYEEKFHLLQKILFFICGILISIVIITT